MLCLTICCFCFKMILMKKIDLHGLKKEKKTKPFKKCPRCGNRCLAAQTKCEECDLLFSRMEFASNRAAKKQLRRFDRDYIIYTNDLPKDVNWWKLLILCLFTGLFGGHYYYVGKYVKGALMSLGFVYLVICTAFNDKIIAMTEALFLPIGIMALGWMVSIVFVLSRRFKVPVLVDIPTEVQEDMKHKRQEFEQVKQDLKQEHQTLAKQEVGSEKAAGVGVLCESKKESKKSEGKKA